ncbi:MAG: glycoside hydrolase family 18 protein [Bacteroidales bacterium]|jgi:chitinase|nr:glycoside hydrolase family 18 protein [Bacteroidales bacterium]
MLLKKYFLPVVLAAVMASCVGTEDSAPKRVVVAYVTSWSGIMPDPAVLTHINYAFGGVTPSFDGVHIGNEARLREIAALKQDAPALKVCLSVGGWGSGNFSEMAATDSLRAAFAADCARVVEEYGLDGIDIDWEYPTSSAAGISASPEDTEHFNLLMRDLRKALGPGRLLTLASVCSAKYVDFPAILPYIDFVNIMSYDMGWAPLHNAALYRSDAEGKISPVAGDCTADEAVKAHLAAGVPPDRLVMGMPLYGRGKRQTYGDFVNYRDLHGPREGDVEVWDDVARVPYYADGDGVLQLGFENVRSISEKCNYILENRLLGGMYWEYAGDNPSGDLTRTIADSLLTDNQQTDR